ncbi:hypothetical protein ACFUJU_36075 [Streptomyces sp. NPDC057235]|uniref:hypothetical protein n=1 Tax=Streptomyces sp. NPDC057235 TaxID=3346058 RepID=UPI003634EA15
MDALKTRLRLTAEYLKRESSTAVDELMTAAFHAVHTPAGIAGELVRRGEGPAPLPPTGGELRSAHHPITKEERRTQFQEELRTLLDRERKETIDGPALRRIAELTELFQDENAAQIWWERAAHRGDAVARMMLADH